MLWRLDFLNLNFELLKFMEALELDSNRTSSLGRMIQVNLFECSSFVLEAKFSGEFWFLENLMENKSGVPSYLLWFQRINPSLD